jgi:hypothetical protein
MFALSFVLPQVFSVFFGVSITVGAMLGYAAIFGGIPLLVWFMFGPSYKIFLKPYVRAWRINRIRSRRDLQDATNRNR